MGRAWTSKIRRVSTLTWPAPRPVNEALTEMTGGSSYQAGAHLLLMQLILFPYVGFRSLGEALGIENMLALLAQRPGADIAAGER